MKFATTLRASEIAQPLPETHRARVRYRRTTRAIQLGVSAVLGLPLVLSVAAAMRPERFPARYVFFGGTSSIAAFVAWTFVSACASLWLGVGLRFGLPGLVARRVRDALAAFLILGGAAGLMLGARLLSLRVGV